MADPYREPVDDTSAPPAVAASVPTASPASPAPAVESVPASVPNGFIPGDGDTLPMPDAPAAQTAPMSAAPAPVIPAEAPAVAPSLGIPGSGPGVPPVTPTTTVTPPIATAATPAHPEAAISVMPTPASPDAKVDTPLREIPLQDIPEAVQTKQPIEPTIIMPPAQDAVTSPETSVMSKEDPALRTSAPTPTQSPASPASDLPTAPAPHLAGEIPLQKIPEMPMTPPPTPAAPAIPASVPIEAAPARESAIRTLETDIASHVQKNQLSIAQIAMAQKEKDRGVVAASSDDGGGKGFIFGVLSTILVLGGLAALGAVVYSLRDSFDVPFFDEGSRVATIIPAERIMMFDVSTTTRTAVFSRIDDFIRDPGAQVLDVRALIFTQAITGTTTRTETLSLEDFMDLIGTRAPGRLVRTLGPEMTFGAIGNEPFLLVRHTSYENAFAGLLEWEPLMRDDLPFLLYTPPERPPFLPEPEQPASDATTTSDTALPSAATSTSTTTPMQDGASTTPATTTPAQEEVLPLVLPATWKDIVVRNVDTRALIREDGELLMLYSFVAQDLLLITTRKETMTVIRDILATPSFGE